MATTAAATATALESETMMGLIVVTVLRSNAVANALDTREPVEDIAAPAHIISCHFCLAVFQGSLSVGVVFFLFSFEAPFEYGLGSGLLDRWISDEMFGCSHKVSHNTTNTNTHTRRY